MGLKELEKRLEHEPDNLGLRVMVAGALREAGRHDDANALYLTVARTYRDQGRFQQAIAVCRSALEQAPGDAKLRELLEVLTAPPLGAPAPAAPLTTAQRPAVRAPTTPAPPPPQGPQAPPARPAQAIPRPAPPRSVPPPVPARRSSQDVTPLPRAVPYHEYDPTSASIERISLSELPTAPPAPTPPNDTRPGAAPAMSEGPKRGENREKRGSVAGLASAARRISRTLSGDDIDVAAELDTRQHARLEPDAAQRLSEPPTVPTERIEQVEIDEDATTPVPLETRDAEDELTNPRDHVMEKRGPLDSPLFAALPAERRSLVLSRFYRRSVKKSGTVIRQGETSHPLVLVVSGRLEVRAERANGTIAMLEALGELDFVGESWLLARTPADANVVAASDAELLLLSAHDVFEIAGAFPAWWAHLKTVAERRAREHERKR